MKYINGSFAVRLGSIYVLENVDQTIVVKNGAALQRNTLRERKGMAAVISSCLPNEARSSSYPSGADTTFTIICLFGGSDCSPGTNSSLFLYWNLKHTKT